MPDTLPPLPSLHWMSPLLAGGGYSSEALGFALGLAEEPTLKAKISLQQMAEQPDEDFVHGLDEHVRTTLSRLLDRGSRPSATRGVVVCHAPPDAWLPSKYPGWDQIAPCPPPGAAYSIGRAMYETDSMPADWVGRCEQMDEVWVPTEFHRGAFAAAGVPEDKLVVVGEPVDTAFFDPAAHEPLHIPGGDGPLSLEYDGDELRVRSFGGGEELRAAAVSATGATAAAAAPPTSGEAAGSGGGGRRFRFLSVFKWEERKGWDTLLEAYLREFGADEAVELVIKTRPFHSSSDFGAILAEFAAERQLPHARRPAVRILDEEVPMRSLPRLYRAADAFVLPSRGEGWGRPHVEAMAMGLPVIATNWSGPTAFLSEATGYPLEFELAPLPAALNQPGHHWAEPSVPHLRQLMRRVYDDPAEARRRGAAARAHMEERFSPARLAAEVGAQLERIRRSDAYAAKLELRAKKKSRRKR